MKHCPQDTASVTLYLREVDVSVRRSCAHAILSFALLLLSLASAQGADNVSFDIEINAPREYAKLLRENLDIYQWQGQEVDVDFLRQLYTKAQKQIPDLLATEGYYSPHVQARLVQSGERWIARFEVSPGVPVRVRGTNIQFEGAIVKNEQERIARLRDQWSLKPGKVFRQSEWEQAKRELLRSLLIEHYPAARLVNSQATVDPDRRAAQLQVHIDSGPLFTFGGLVISGIQRYPVKVIENLNPIKPGAPYSQKQIFELQARLQNTGYFKTVNVVVDAEAARSTQVPVTVSVVEQETKALGFGIGYSTDTGVRGKVEYSHRDIADRGWRFSTGVQADQVRQSVYGGLDFPARADGARDGILTAYSHQEIEGEITDNTRVTASRAQTKGRVDRVLSLQYQQERQGVAGAIGEERKALTPNAAWTLRAVNDLLYPTRGYLANVQVGGAHDALLSDQRFLRLYIKGAYYFPLGERDSLMLRAERGAVRAPSRAGIPSDFLFRAGGDQSVRGYDYQTLGVREGEAIVGGRYLAVESVEYIHWFRPQWGAALFYDRGDAADSMETLDPVAGYGLGLRWRSPIGPVNLDVAYGEAPRDYRFHLTLGFVF